MPVQRKTSLQSDTAKDAASQPLPGCSSWNIPGREAGGLMLTARDPAAGEDPRVGFPHQNWSRKPVEVPNILCPSLAAVLSCTGKGWWVNTYISSGKDIQGLLFYSRFSRDVGISASLESLISLLTIWAYQIFPTSSPGWAPAQSPDGLSHPVSTDTESAAGPNTPELFGNEPERS